MNSFNRQVGDWTKLRSGHVVVDRDIRATRGASRQYGMASSLS